MSAPTPEEQCDAIKQAFVDLQTSKPTIADVPKDRPFLVVDDLADPLARAAAVRVAAVNASDAALVAERFAADTTTLVGTPVAARLALLEIWRPLRYVGSVGPRVFWREGRVLATSASGRPIWDKPTEWRVMDREFARKALSMPGGFFVLDDSPGVTFCVRRFNAPIEGDWAQARALREAVVKCPVCESRPRAPNVDTCAECGGPQ